MNEGMNPLFDCARPGSSIAEVERQTYFQLLVTYCIYQISQAMLLILVVVVGNL